MTANTSNDLRPLLLLTLSLVLTVAVFYPALSGGFIFDDYSIFVENPITHVSGWHWQPWEALWAWSRANIQRPLAMSSYALNYAFGADAHGFKVTNLIIHLLNAVLIWQFVRRLLTAAWKDNAACTGRTHELNIQYWAIGITAAWSIHPLQISTVMYVVQRMEMLGLMFVLLALLAYWRGRQNQIAGKPGWFWLLLSIALTWIGYYAKETAVLTIGYAFLLELCVLHFGASNPSTGHGWKLFYVTGFIVALALFAGYLIPHYAVPAAYTERDFTAWERELTQLRVLAMYLGWSVLPLPGMLHFYYDNYPASTSLLHPATTWLSGAFLLTLLLAAVKLRHRRPLFTLGVGWFFLANALTSSPLPLELVFEHRNYPALLGVLLALADLLQMLSLRVQPRVVAILGIVFVANFAFLCTIRAATWGSPLRLAMTLTQTNPGSPRAALDLARRLVAMSGDDPSNPLYSLGIKELERAAKLPTASILPEDALIIQEANHPGTVAWPAWQTLQGKLQTRPMGPGTYQTLTGLQREIMSGNSGIDAHQLALAYQTAIRRNPTRVSLHVQYADLLGTALKDPKTAIEQWNQVLEMQKNVPSYETQLASYLINSNRDTEALAVIAKAQSMQPALKQDTTIMGLRAKAEQGNGAAAAHTTER